MRLPKNFQPVGTSKHSIFCFLATRSKACEVGMERAQPLRPSLNCGMRLLLATSMATESDGETKNCELITMLRSASPSAAAPKVGGGDDVSILLPPLSKPIVLTSSTAYVKLGSACPCQADSGPPKSSFGSAFVAEPGFAPSSSSMIFLAYGPWTPLMLSYTMEKSGLVTIFFICSKLKHFFSKARWSSTLSNTSTVRSPMVYVAALDKSISGTLSQILYSEILAVHSTILFVIFSGAGPPFSQLYLIPKSSFSPPGLWEAEQMKPPKDSKPLPLHRITAEVAGVDSKPPVPHQTLPTPLARAILMMIWIAVLFQNRPSPDTTKVPPATGTFSSSRVLKTLCTKLCK
mmetsp:Transcript_21947/g.51324  ORF Transcript_21947/g.51324 Transcript_21947/m.51324 type:complete len:347 (-) Transcript_21947:198-1238(-)